MARDIYRRLFDLSGRAALVVGAGSGIGRASAEALAAHGARVVCADLQGRAAQATAEAIRAEGGEAAAEAINILDRPAIEGLVGDILADYGRLDVAIVTPGINIRKRLLDYRDEEFERVVAVNLRGTLNVLVAAGRAMAEQGSGSLIALSSIRWLVVEPGQGVYAATKAGIVQLVRTLAAELGPSGVRANAVAPGVIDTPLTAPIKTDPAWYEAYAAKTVLGRWGRPEEVAGAILFLASDASSYVTGSVLLVDGGWTAADGRYEPRL